MSLIDALAQRFIPTTRTGKLKFNSPAVLALCIQECLSNYDVRDGSVIEIVNELTEWENYEALEGFIERNSGNERHTLYTLHILTLTSIFRLSWSSQESFHSGRGIEVSQNARVIGRGN